MNKSAPATPATYRIIDAPLDEVKAIGSYRWQKAHGTSRGAMFPFVAVLFFALAIFMRLGLLWVVVGCFLPLGIGLLDAWRQSKKRKKAAEIFVNSPSVRKNGVPLMTALKEQRDRN